MAGSVWLKEVDTALLELIPTIVKYYDENDDLVSSAVMVRNPEGTYKIEEFPSVSIFNYNQVFASERYDREEVLTKRDIERKVAVLEKSALPYYLYYQIDFWAKYQEDINEMTRRWLGFIPRNFVLEVKDTEGNIRHCNMELVDFANADYVKGDERIFHRVYSYRIWVELDEGYEKEYPVVIECEIRRNLYIINRRD